MLRAQRRHGTLTETERELAGRAVRHSDNVAATELWHGIGGTSGLAAAGRALGLRHTAPGPGDYWGSTVTSAADQIRVLSALTSARGPLTGEHRRLLLGLMARVAPEQAWGISAAAGDGDEVALKNGWLPRKPDGGLWTVNSIGRLRRAGHDRLVAVLTTRHTSMAAGIAMAEHVAATVARNPAR
nr:serine hydrolase [Actinomadura rayongensis]